MAEATDKQKALIKKITHQDFEGTTQEASEKIKELLKEKVKDEPEQPVDQPKTQGRSYGKSKEELTQQRQLAEAQNRSIQAQTALNRAVDLVVAYKEDINRGEAKEFLTQTANEFYQLLQSLTQISEAQVIYQKVKEATVKPVAKERPSDEEIKDTLAKTGKTRLQIANTIKDKVPMDRDVFVMIKNLTDEDFWEFWEGIK